MESQPHALGEIMREPLDLKRTLNLPKTDFPMKANLPQNEPKWLEKWEKMGIYGKIREARQGSPIYVLHDGPPYANGAIHNFMIAYEMSRAGAPGDPEGQSCRSAGSPTRSVLGHASAFHGGRICRNSDCTKPVDRPGRCSGAG